MIDPAHPVYDNTPVAPLRPQYEYDPIDKLSLPSVTIVTPFHNTGTVFHETARSVLQQSLQQWEWLIINDGSTDPESLKVLEYYRHSDPRVRVIDHTRNQGPGVARNAGFRMAQAAYVGQLDSDDLLEPTALEKWLWFLESYSEFAFVSGYSVGFGAQQYLWSEGFHRGAAFLEDNLVDTNTMVRRAVHQKVGGYDEAMQGGMEDWEFWLRCANHGYWGGTVPEYLDWYRRRPTHTDRWADWDSGERQQSRQTELRRRYPSLWDGKFPQPQLRWHAPHTPVPIDLPCHNRLQKRKSRLLMILPWMTIGGADKFNLDVLQQLTQRGWEISIATTLHANQPWFPTFACYTPDIFILPHFLRLVDYPRFLHYLIVSRDVDVVIISNSELGYHVLPYLRAQCPTVAFLDFCHMEEEQWKNGGYPQRGVEYQKLLDLNIVASQHLQQWMAQRGAETRRVRVCYINVDPKHWTRSDVGRRTQVRREYSLSETVPVISYVGRICAQKRPQIFAETIQQLALQGESFAAVVAGDGPDLDWLRTFVKKHGLDAHVRLLGAVTNERVRDLLSATDIFFLPSEWEGIALSIYEAMACGVVVVGADVGGQRELVTQDCGILVARSDEATEVQQYTEALALLLRDESRRQRMGQAGRQRIETFFTIEQMGEHMATLVSEALQLHREQPRLLPTVDMGRICVNQAIEYVRLSEVADGLWQERGQATSAVLYPHLLDPHQDSWRTLAYFAVRRLLLPYYRAALERHLTWLLPVKNRLKYILLQKHG